MNLEGRKNNIYFDKNGIQILEGDLLKVWHFIGARRKINYMYHVAVIEQTKDFPVMSIRDYDKEKPHCRLYVLCDNEERMYKDAEIISERDWETERLKITPLKKIPNGKV